MSDGESSEVPRSVHPPGHTPPFEGGVCQVFFSSHPLEKGGCVISEGLHTPPSQKGLKTPAHPPK